MWADVAGLLGGLIWRRVVFGSGEVYQKSSS